MKKKQLHIILILIPLLFLCFCHMANRPPQMPELPPSAPIPPGHTEPVVTDQPSLKLYASGACLMDAASGRILYGKEEAAPLPMASTTKIMTCLLALENGNLNDTVTFSSRASSMPKVHLGASSGNSFALEDLLYSLMLESHNDTAVAIAEHLGGSVEGFAGMMNTKAAELGMNQTHFVTPNGLDADGHASTPADMCLLAAYACQNETFLKIVQTPSRTIRDTTGKRAYSLSNKDAFLTSYNGALGIKTGFTGKAGYCFVGAARRENRTFTTCVLASGWPPDKSRKWADTKKLMDFGFENFTYQHIPVQDLSSVRIAVEDGRANTVEVTMPQIPDHILSPFDSIDIEYRLPVSLKAPVRTDMPAGSIEVSVNGTPSGSYAVYPKENIEKVTLVDACMYIIHLFFDF